MVDGCLPVDNPSGSKNPNGATAPGSSSAAFMLKREDLNGEAQVRAFVETTDRIKLEFSILPRWGNFTESRDRSEDSKDDSGAEHFLE